MVEMRWIDRSVALAARVPPDERGMVPVEWQIVRVLQYRQQIEVSAATNGFLFEKPSESVWSQWLDVPVILNAP